MWQRLRNRTPKMTLRSLHAFHHGNCVGLSGYIYVTTYCLQDLLHRYMACVANVATLT